MKVRYHHDAIGVNSRLDSIQAAVLDAKLPHLEEHIANRQSAAAYYNKRFVGNSSIKTPVVASYSTHSFHQYTLRIEGIDRKKLIDEMAQKGIPMMIYYPIPIHLQTAYKNLSNKQYNLPIAEKLSCTVCSLPMHTELDEEQLDYIATNLLDIISHCKV